MHRQPYKYDCSDTGPRKERILNTLPINTSSDRHSRFRSWQGRNHLVSKIVI